MLCWQGQLKTFPQYCPLFLMMSLQQCPWSQQGIGLRFEELVSSSQDPLEPSGPCT